MLRTLGIVLALAASEWLWTPPVQAQAPVPDKPEAAKEAKDSKDAKTPETPKPEAKPPADPIDRIKEEGEKRSQVMATLSVLELKRMVKRLPGHQFVRA